MYKRYINSIIIIIIMIRNWSQELAEIEIVFNGMYSK